MLQPLATASIGRRSIATSSNCLQSRLFLETDGTYKFNSLCTVDTVIVEDRETGEFKQMVIENNSILTKNENAKNMISINWTEDISMKPIKIMIMPKIPKHCQNHK